LCRHVAATAGQEHYIKGLDRSWGRDKDRIKGRDRNRVVDHCLPAVQATEYCSKGRTKTIYVGLERGDRDSDRNRDTNRDKEVVVD
jgi:hypothetical protein